ncbi:MAG: RNA-binding transcriptional accessory protein [Bacteroidales bacterium]|nr:RNA-binding transcriptional accessory protein [Bacteroidales bacterium]MCF8328295.1 RNA-binding transcriptional accessory protein [Bacteroidales bacterium]
MEKLVSHISGLTQINERNIQRVLELLDEGATIPFIARYRKGKTGNLDEQQVVSIRDTYHQLIKREDRRESILRSIDEQGKLTPELEKQINNIQTLNELEDLYLPFKKKRKTRASKAIEQGLEPLAGYIMNQADGDPYKKALMFVDESKDIHNADDAIGGALDIMAAWINERLQARNRMRKFVWENSVLFSQKSKEYTEEKAHKYKTYADYREYVKKIPSHRYLAITRGEKEGYLNVRFEVDNNLAAKRIEPLFVKTSGKKAELIRTALMDSLKRLMLPSLETEIRSELKQRSDKKAIEIFQSNLYQLLMSPGMGEKRVLAIDPGFKSGCKIVCLDESGNLLDNDTIYPHPPQKDTVQAAKKLRSLTDAYKIDAIAIGNGTAGRETEVFVQSKVKFNKDIVAAMVDESGASVYSASKVAREEFPEYDVTVRGAVSIGRRLMDPLAELVKIDPKSIGVGQYQHDVDQKDLAKSLEDIVIQCVNRVGVDVNTASKELLTYVSGIGPGLAQNIVDYRKNTAFVSRDELKKVPKLGPKAFEQAAGFLRIKNGKQPLDESAVHPESYYIVRKIAKSLGVKPEKLIRNSELLQQINPKDFVEADVGLPTVQDILKELEKPGRDPRENLKTFEFDRSLRTIEDVKPGMVVPGQVNNITAFGCFVDIGIKENGLIHVSELADRFISDPAEVVVLHQQLRVKVISVDTERKRIQLSLKQVE